VYGLHLPLGSFVVLLFYCMFLMFEG